MEKKYSYLIVVKVSDGIVFMFCWFLHKLAHCKHSERECYLILVLVYYDIDIVPFSCCIRGLQ